MIDLVKPRFWYFLLSALIIAPGIISLAIFGLRPGIDFSSGSTLTLRFSQEIELGQLRQELAALGYSEAVVQRTGEGDFFIRLREISTEEKGNLVAGLVTVFGGEVTERDFYSVSPVIARETGRNAAIAVLAATIAILLYITWAFRRMPKPFRWGSCAVIALTHDVILILGVFSILGWVAGVEVNAMFISGMLAVVGYSVHNTIVVFDRIRENLSKGVSPSFEVTVNYGLVETLTRSLNTALTTLFVLGALYLFGGVTIRSFVLVLIIGIMVGTYSSMFNASQLLVVWEKKEWRRFLFWLPFARR